MAQTSQLKPVPARPEVPGSTLVWVLLAAAMLWFAGRLWALRSMAAVASDTSITAALMIFTVPALISAALVLGNAGGLGMVRWRGSAAQRWQARAGYGAAGGLLAAGICGGAMYASGGERAVTAAVVAVAVAALLGGLVAALPSRVAAAGLTGAVVVAAVQFVAALFVTPLRGALDGSGSGVEVATAGVRLAMIIGVASGIAAGLSGYAVLRRLRPAAPADYALAGGMGGVLLLAAEAITRVTVPLLVARAGGNTADDPLVLGLTGQARLNTALLVLFAGTITSLVALGRNMPKRQAGAPEPAATGAEQTGED